MNSASDEQTYCTVNRWCEVSGLGVTKTYELIAEGSLPARKCGKRTLIDLQAGRRFLNSLPRLPTRQAA